MFINVCVYKKYEVPSMTLLVKGMLGFLFIVIFYFNNMEKKVVLVFIDGNNWHHNSKSVINPNDIDFDKLVKFICNHFDFIFKKPIRYYNSIPDISDGELMYYKHMEFLTSLKKQGIEVITRKLQKSSTKEIKQEKEGMINSLDLCANCKPLVKQNCDECVGNVKKKEKGIDIKIAVDMIKKCLIENECDCCILISGDADFIPAMQVIKDAKKEVVTSSVLAGYSRELRDGRFRYFFLDRRDVRKYCLKDYKLLKRES